MSYYSDYDTAYGEMYVQHPKFWKMESKHGDEVIRVQYIVMRRRWEEDLFSVDAEYGKGSMFPNATVSKAEAIRRVEDYEVDAHQTSHLKDTKAKVAGIMYTYKCRHSGNVYTDLPINTEHNVGDFGWHYTHKCEGSYQHDELNKVCHSCRAAEANGHRTLTDKELHDLNETGWLS